MPFAYSFMYEQVGHIAIINVKGKITREKLKELKEKARELLKLKPIETVLLKQEKVKGRLRKASYRLLAGKRHFEALHKENNCVFKLNPLEVYFSSRLAANRLWLAQKILDFIKAKKIKKARILVGFCGVGVYGIVIAKILQRSKVPYSMTMVELNRKAVKYAKENVKLNKLNNIEVLQGDVKRILPKLSKFDFIIWPRPQLAYDFFKECFINTKKGSIIFYFDFIDENELKHEAKKLEEKARQLGKRIKVLEIKKAGQIAPRRWRIVGVFGVG